MQCPGCKGELSRIETPSLVFVGMDVEAEMTIDLTDTVPLFCLIPRICLKCGYYEQVQFFTQDEFELYSQKRLTVEINEHDNIMIVRKPEGRAR